MRIKPPVPGCETWVTYSDLASVSPGGSFSFVVDLREDGLWRNDDTFTNNTTAQGVAEFVNIYFGMSCGTWSGSVDWMAI